MEPCTSLNGHANKLGTAKRAIDQDARRYAGTELGMTFSSYCSSAVVARSSALLSQAQ